MSRPHKRLSVTPEIRKRWLRRYDEYGESLSQIASKDGYDPRTVRRQIELARQEVETRETRLLVLRSAAESHYQDLCRFAERIDSSVSRNESIDNLIPERLYSALKQHLPRSPLWPYLDRWNNLQRYLNIARADLEKAIDDLASKDGNLDKAFAEGEKDVSGVVELFMRQWELWTKPNSGLEIEASFKTEPMEGGLARYKVGAYVIGSGNISQVKEIKKALMALKEALLSSEQIQTVKKVREELEKLKPDIQEELATYSLRRVFPGRCKYCPI